MRDEMKCRKIYRAITIDGKTANIHCPDIKICRKCRYFTLTGCNAYRRFKAEQQAKDISNH